MLHHFTPAEECPGTHYEAGLKFRAVPNLVAKIIIIIINPELR
jgi:hypothetical protein